jgi:signal transduction protein with GAF and PtsI domain
VHTDEIDCAVAVEDIVAILGVPLTVSDRVIGVLFAADRSPRQFTPDEVNLLGSLAAHAAIAIENARLFQETRRALDELSAADEIVRAHSEAVERAAAVHERLTGVILEGGDMDAVAVTVGDVLDADVAVLDADLQVLSNAGDPSWADAATDRIRSDLRRVRAAGRTVRIDGDDGTFWATSVAAGGDQLGVLLVRLAHDLGDVAPSSALPRRPGCSC